MEDARNGPARESGKWKWLACGLAGGIVLAGLFAYMIHATDQRAFCASCHIMQEAAVTQKKSMHANLSCNDCHAPQNFVAKVPFKLVAATEDVWGNIVGKPVPVPPSQTQRDVIRQNCINCHAPVNRNVAVMAVKPYCTDCHRSVAHMRLNPISERTVGYD